MTNNNYLFQEALKLHQAGELTAAAAFYHKILNKQPGHIDVIFLLGTLYLQLENLDIATTFLKKAIALKPDHVTAYNNLGTAFQKQCKLDEAIASYRRAIALKPDYAEAQCNLGNALKEQGSLDKAAVNYRQAILSKPDYVDAHYNLGNTLKEQRKLDKAVESYKRTIALKPDYAMAHCNLGSVLQELGKIDEAIASCKLAITLKPDYAMAHCNLGSAFQELGRLDEAITSYRKAITLNPDYVVAHSNLGSALQELGRLDEAITSYRKAIRLKPDYAMAHCNLGSALQELSKIEEAIESYNRAIVLKPDEAIAHKNKSIALLLIENFKEGWPEYEWRLRTKDHSLRDFQKPKWDGAPLNGKFILVHAEQGFGDTIQFVRYLPMVKSQGGHVIFECRQNLFRLLKNCAGIDKIIENISTNEPSVQFDIHIPLLSLPGIFGTTLDSIPSDVPYITVDSRLVEQWRIRLEHDNNFKIGIVWAGNPTFKNYHNRSCSLADFAILSEIPGLSFYSLQKGPASVETNNPPEGMKIINLENELNDFADTAAVIDNLDLIISTDTAVVHLAGAIGKPVWTLLHSAPDWRWLLNRDDSPWYPRPNGLAGRAGMCLFRQSKLNDWSGVFEQVKEALLYELTTKGCRQPKVSSKQYAVGSIK
ncbi:MAG: peptidase [Candidatus Scalindua rubra]|uniref:Peptidase n=1 Tax=Candidatus Scalindua rubra TaxID=1872076 RepID=A0A1E3XE00_9BACT|nr:MAG: peptidase [Candidatus Scalindua rubra]